VKGHSLLRAIRNVILAFMAGIMLVVVAGVLAAAAKADVPCHKQTVPWGFLGSERRTICDTARAADGSWTRERIIWSPAGYVPGGGYCGTWSCSYTEGYYVQQSVKSDDVYPVNDGDVLPDEPGNIW
jgi:hypothetical protein